MSWILMIWLGNSVGITYIDYPTYLGCQEARAELIQKRWFTSSQLLCIERK